MAKKRALTTAVGKAIGDESPFNVSLANETFKSPRGNLVHSTGNPYLASNSGNTPFGGPKASAIGRHMTEGVFSNGAMSSEAMSGMVHLRPKSRLERIKKEKVAHVRKAPTEPSGGGRPSLLSTSKNRQPIKRPTTTASAPTATTAMAAPNAVNSSKPSRMKSLRPLTDQDKFSNLEDGANVSFGSNYPASTGDPYRLQDSLVGKRSSKSNGGFGWASQIGLGAGVGAGVGAATSFLRGGSMMEGAMYGAMFGGVGSAGGSYAGGKFRSGAAGEPGFRSSRKAISYKGKEGKGMTMNIGGGAGAIGGILGSSGRKKNHNKLQANGWANGTHPMYFK